MLMTFLDRRISATPQLQDGLSSIAVSLETFLLWGSIKEPFCVFFTSSGFQLKQRFNQFVTSLSHFTVDASLERTTESLAANKKATMKEGWLNEFTGKERRKGGREGGREGEGGPRHQANNE